MGKRSGGRKGGDNIIHVRFGNGGGRVEPNQGITGATATAQAMEPVTDLFSAKEVSRLFGLTPSRLRSLDRAKIVSPSGERNGKRAYTFQDLIALRATVLLSREVKLREVARAIGALRQALPRVTRPLQELRLVSDGRHIVVRSPDADLAGGRPFEPVTGQLVMDFDVALLRTDVVHILRPETPHARARTAYDLYVRASALDEDPATYDEAEALYREAIDLDPQLAIAHTNLGNILFRRGEDRSAESLYMTAIAIDDRQPEAHYNLGYVMLERGDAKRAADHFEKAISRDSRFADAHFNLAMACEQLGERSRARIHWKRYLDLEPQGTWADIARKHLS
jgi:tetratricopeptide (TPR) repeat protein